MLSGYFSWKLNFGSFFVKCGCSSNLLVDKLITRFLCHSLFLFQYIIFRIYFLESDCNQPSVDSSLNKICIFFLTVVLVDWLTRHLSLYLFMQNISTCSSRVVAADWPPGHLFSIQIWQLQEWMLAFALKTFSQRCFVQIVIDLICHVTQEFMSCRHVLDLTF